MKISLNFIGLIITLVLTTQVSFAVPYSDINKSNKYFFAIEDFTNKAIIEGYEDGTFKSNQPINRAEALKIILKAFNKDSDDLGTENFSDVQESDWFYTFVLQGLKHEIIQGYQDGTFKPGNQVLFSESLKMALEADGLEIESVEFKDFHPSVVSTDWFAKYFSYGFNKNFISLETNGSLNPIRPMTRGEFVDLVYKIQATATDEDFDISYNWKDENVNNGLVLSYPFEWSYYNLGEGVFLGYFADQKPSFIKNVANGARISINFWPNPDQISQVDYFTKLKSDFETKYSPSVVELKEETNSYGPSLSVFIKDKGIFDYYIYLENKTVLYAEGSFDAESLKSLDLIKEIQKIYDEIRYDPKLNLSAEQKLELARKSIFVSGQGLNTLDLFIQKELFKTDSIGFGTGPIDYYYLSGADHTIVHDRVSDSVLGVLKGKTDIFTP